MNKWVKIAIILVIVGAVAAGLGYKFVYNKPHPNFEKATPDYSLSSSDLFSSYLSDRVNAEQKFNGKVLEVEGEFSNLETPDSLTILVFSIQEGFFGPEGIRCTLLPKYGEEAKKLVPGSKVTIKGFCAGYNDTDVILEKCSIIKQL